MILQQQLHPYHSFTGVHGDNITSVTTKAMLMLMAAAAVATAVVAVTMAAGSHNCLYGGSDSSGWLLQWPGMA